MTADSSLRSHHPLQTSKPPVDHRGRNFFDVFDGPPFAQTCGELSIPTSCARKRPRTRVPEPRRLGALPHRLKSVLGGAPASCHFAACVASLLQSVRSAGSILALLVTLTIAWRHRWGVSGVDLEGAYGKWAGELVGYATALVGPEVAADVVADVFANLVALGPSRWDTVDDQRGYLFRCVLNATRMHARSNGRRTAREQFASRLRTGPTLPAADAFSDPWVGDAIASLSVQQRAVIYHTYWTISPRQSPGFRS